MAKTKTLTHEEVIDVFYGLLPTQQIIVFEKIKQIMDEQEAQRQQLSADYQKVKNGDTKQ